VGLTLLLFLLLLISLHYSFEALEQQQARLDGLKQIKSLGQNADSLVSVFGETTNYNSNAKHAYAGQLNSVLHI
jgi:hypothetical protein